MTETLADFGVTIVAADHIEFVGSHRDPLAPLVFTRTQLSGIIKTANQIEDEDREAGGLPMHRISVEGPAEGLGYWRDLAEAVRDSPKHRAIELDPETLIAIIDMAEQAGGIPSTTQKDVSK